MKIMPALSKTLWMRALASTLALIAVSIVISIVMSALGHMALGSRLGMDGLIWASVMPVLIGGPMILVASLFYERLRLAYRELERIAAHDSLTGCLNHGAFAQRVDAYLQAGPEAEGALLVIDADHFKAINDRFGHHKGDAALKLIAKTIRATARSGDLVGRLGGEEFGVFLPGASRATAWSVAERIRLAVAGADFSIEGERQPLSVSVGGAVFAEGADFDALFRFADRRLYDVKDAGRNGVGLTALPAPREATLARAG